MLNNSKGISTALFNLSKKFFGKNEKAIKMRIKSVSSIEKITKAMKMVIIISFKFKLKIKNCFCKKIDKSNRRNNFFLTQIILSLII